MCSFQNHINKNDSERQLLFHDCEIQKTIVLINFSSHCLNLRVLTAVVFQCAAFHQLTSESVHEILSALILRQNNIQEYVSVSCTMMSSQVMDSTDAECCQHDDDWRDTVKTYDNRKTTETES